MMRLRAIIACLLNLCCLTACDRSQDTPALKDPSTERVENSNAPLTPAPDISHNVITLDGSNSLQDKPISPSDDKLNTPPLENPEDDELRLHYYNVTNSQYLDIVIEFGEIRYTYFPDLEQRCRNWVKDTPCWNKADLRFLAAPLAQEELDNLFAITDDYQLFSLAEDDYGTPSKQANIENISLSFGDLSRDFTYYNTPLGQAKPEGLAAIETALLQSARNLEGEYEPQIPEGQTLTIKDTPLDKEGKAMVGAE